MPEIKLPPICVFFYQTAGKNKKMKHYRTLGWFLFIAKRRTWANTCFFGWAGNKGQCGYGKRDKMTPNQAIEAVLKFHKENCTQHTQ